MSNAHIVDQFVAVKAEIARLSAVADALKVQIDREIAGSGVLEGDEWVALQSITERKGALDERKIKDAGLDPDAFRKASSAIVSIRTVLKAAHAA